LGGFDEIRRHELDNPTPHGDDVEGGACALIERTRYMKAVEDEGKVIMAGGFMEGTGGMDISECDTLEEAMEICDKAPLRKGNFIRQEIKAWSTDLATRTKMFTKMFENLS
jgi:uncharacterized protein YciI